MGHADLAGRGRVAAAVHAGIADCVVRRAERTAFDQPLVRRQPAHSAVDVRRLQALDRCQRGAECREALRQHRLASGRTADHQQIPTPCKRYYSNNGGIQ